MRRKAKENTNHQVTNVIERTLTRIEVREKKRRLTSMRKDSHYKHENGELSEERPKNHATTNVFHISATTMVKNAIWHVIVVLRRWKKGMLQHHKRKKCGTQKQCMPNLKMLMIP